MRHPAAVVHYRPAGAADSSSVREVRRRALAALPPGVYSDFQLRTWQRVSEAPEVGAGVTFIVAEEGSRVLGYGYARGNHVEELYVLPDHQRCGHGARLLARLEHGIRLTSTSASVHAIPSAQPFYAARGYSAVCGVQLWLSISCQLHAVWMRKALEQGPGRDADLDPAPPA